MSYYKDVKLADDLSADADWQRRGMYIGPQVSTSNIIFERKDIQTTETSFLSQSLPLESLASNLIWIHSLVSKLIWSELNRIELTSTFLLFFCSRLVRNLGHWGSESVHWILGRERHRHRFGLLHSKLCRMEGTKRWVKEMDLRNLMSCSSTRKLTTFFSIWIFFPSDPFSFFFSSTKSLIANCHSFRIRLMVGTSQELHRCLKHHDQCSLSPLLPFGFSSVSPSRFFFSCLSFSGIKFLDALLNLPKGFHPLFFFYSTRLSEIALTLSCRNQLWSGPFFSCSPFLNAIFALLFDQWRDGWEGRVETPKDRWLCAEKTRGSNRADPFFLNTHSHLLSLIFSSKILLQSFVIRSE